MTRLSAIFGRLFNALAVAAALILLAMVIVAPRPPSSRRA